MADKPVTVDVAAASQYAASVLNDNFNTIEEAIEGCLGRGGTSESPNSMEGDLDLDLNDLLNVGTLNTTILNVGGVQVTPSIPLVINEVVVVEGLSSLVASTPFVGGIVYIRGRSSAGDGGEGHFRWADTNLATEVLEDTQSGIYVAPSSDLTGASGAWVRQYTGAISILWFGSNSVPGTTDMTIAIQGALNAAQHVSIPAGRYLVSSTLVGIPGQVIEGAGPEITIIQRTANYGSTLICGNTAASQGALNLHITGVWFYKPQEYTAGVTTTITNPVTPNSSHVEVTVATGGGITDCWFTGMPYGVTVQLSSLFDIKKCQFSGLWDPLVVGLQEGVASIYLKSGGAYNVTLNIEGNSIAGGYATEVRSTVIGSETLNIHQSAGAQYGILCEAAEGLVVTGNYFGGHSVYEMLIQRTNICAGIKVSGNFFDPATDTCIYTTTISDAALDGLVITDNNFNGQTYGLHAIRLNNPGTWISAVNVNISNNVIENFSACPIIISGGKGVVVGGNTISAYNTAGPLNVSADFSAGIYVYGDAESIHTNNNIYGGGINALGVVNNCKWGVYFQGVTDVSSLGERISSFGLAGGAVVYGVEQSYPSTRTLQTPTLLNSWVNSGAGTTQAGYWKDSEGNVYLQGLLSSGTVGGVLFNLPVGYRPSTQVTFSTVSNSAFAHGNINSTGDVIAVSGSNSSWSLDTVTFKHS